MSLEHIIQEKTKEKDIPFFRNIFLLSTNPRINGGGNRNRQSVNRDKRRHLENFPGTIHPYSSFRWYWDLLMTAVLIFSLIEEPVQIAYYTLDRDEHDYRVLTIMSMITSIIFFMDISFNFATGIPDIRTGNVVLEKKLIFRKYMKSWFIIDFISSIPFDSFYYFIFLTHPEVLNHHNTFKGIRLLGLLKFFRLFRVLQCLQRIEKAFLISELLGRLINIVLTIIVIAHWLSCFHWLAADLFNDRKSPKPMSWITKTKLWNAPIWLCYINSALRALSNMVSAGYGGGDAPSEPEDVVMVLITMAIGCSCFGLYVGTMAGILQTVDAPRKKFDEMLLEVDEYMKFRSIPKPLQSRMRDYYEKRYRRHYFDEGMILDNVSDVLKNDILIHNCKHLLEGAPLFKELSDSFLKTIVGKLKFEVYLPQDVIIEYGQEGRAMYFIEEGTVKITRENGQLLTRLESGDYFGEGALLTDIHKTNANVIADDYCDIYKLDRNDFNDVFQNHPDVLTTILSVSQHRRNQTNRKRNSDNILYIHE